MIRAEVQNGVIQPLEPLPPHWNDGRKVVVEELEEEFANRAEEMDCWSREMNKLTAGLDDPEEWRQIEETLAEADRQAKNLVRREMEQS